jgi:hypothetical protein
MEGNIRTAAGVQTEGTDIFHCARQEIVLLLGMKNSLLINEEIKEL